MPPSRSSNQADMSTPGPDDTSSCESGPRRSARNEGKHINYDRRLHPSYDKAMKPTQYAKLMDLPRPSPKSWRSSSAASDVSSRSSSSNHSDVSDDGDSVSDTPPTDQHSDEEMPTSRSPDANATRRSSRAAAQKYHNYSRKHHPQDKYLPGRKKRKDTHETRHSTPSRLSKVPVEDDLETSDQTIPEQEPLRKRAKRGSQLSQDRIGNAQDSRRAGATAAVTITSSPVRSQTEDDPEDEQEEDDTAGRAKVSQNKDGILATDREHEANDFQEPMNEHEAALDDEDDDTTPTDDLNALEDMIDGVDTVEVAADQTNVPLDLADVNAAARTSAPQREKSIDNRARQGLTEQEQISRPHGARLSFQDDTLAPEMDMKGENFPTVAKPSAVTESFPTPGHADIIKGLQLIASTGITQEQLMDFLKLAVTQPTPSSSDSFAVGPGSRRNYHETPQSSAQSAFTALSSSAPPVGSQQSSASQTAPTPHQGEQGNPGRSAKGIPRSSSQLGRGSQKKPTGRPSQLGLRPDLSRTTNDAPEGERMPGSAASSQRTSSNASQRPAPGTDHRGRRSGMHVPKTPDPQQQPEIEDDSASTLSGGVVDDMDGLGAIGR
ncbi:hypothetical protein BDZ85DRAFT_316396 [Elsinoe ampelina]|uniref:Uncharacterized protein n=1 Tax=Elsinoe ampelina TaxID=302913 RepID=A0A6A6GN75_9PEZI|nr:hypothetical protein BDZ85DRAFT_316396 [Elsinoe ampelina]